MEEIPGAAGGAHGAADFDAALESCRKAIELGIHGRDVYLVLGDLHLEKMETPEAVAAYGEALKADPSAVEVIPSFALSYLDQDVLWRHITATWR